MPIKAVVVNILMGCALIALGSIPGLFDGLKEGIENLRAAFSHHLPPHWRQANQGQPARGEFWLAAGGAVLILINVVALVLR